MAGSNPNYHHFGMANGTGQAGRPCSEIRAQAARMAAHPALLADIAVQSAPELVLSFIIIN